MRRHFFKKALIAGAVSLTALLAAGTVWQHFASQSDLASYKPPGKLYSVYGSHMHVFTGGEGKATAVLCAGWGTPNPYADFYPLYAKLEKDVKFAVIDRFGYGYSDLTNRKRSIDNIAAEMREALKASQTAPPYILVGHSLGALEVFRFAQLYPDEVKGIVLLDGGSPEYYSSSPPLTFISLLQRGLVFTGAARALYHVDGFAESLADQRNGLKLLPDNLKELDRVSTLLKSNNRNITDEMRESANNAKIVLSGKKPLNVPITVLTAGSFGKADKSWLESQAGIASWSPKTKQIMAENAEHYVHHYEPDLAAREIIALARD